VPIVVHDIHLDEVTDVAKIEKFRDRKREDSRYYVIDFTFQEIKGIIVDFYLIS
jgi:glycerophosphoryl diester phosphodiesterase